LEALINQFNIAETAQANQVRALAGTDGSWLRRRLDQHHGFTGDGLTPADRPNVFTGLGFDVDSRLIHVKHACEVGADRRFMRAELGLLRMNDQVAIDGSPTGLLDPLDHLCQETLAISSLPRWIGVGVMLSNVTQAGSTQEGVGDSMTHNVGVGVPHQPARVGDPESAEYQRSSLAQPVCVVPDAYPQTETPTERAPSFPKCT
jgi:hypothetical protein